MDAAVSGEGTIAGCKAEFVVIDSRFMMGSMGSVVGEKVVRAAERAQTNRVPLVIFSASGGEQGLAIAKEQKPDVILLDIIMPKLNGLDVLKTLKQDNDTKNIPVFLLTNLPQECSGDKAKELGAAGYMVKAESEPKLVVDTVNKALAGTAASPQA